MNPQAFRSVCARARPEVLQTGYALKNYFRDFSTSQSLAAEDTSTPTPPSKPSVRQRTRAATSEINSLVRRGGPRGGSKTGNVPTPQTAASQPKVIDVRSLPRGLSRGRGGFRGRGGGQAGAIPAQGQPPRAQSPAGSRFSRPTTGRGRGSAARGGRGGGRGGRGAAKGRQTDRKDDKDKDKDKKLGKRQDPFEVMDPYEEQFDRDMRFGVTMPFQPSLTVDALSSFAPATPTSVAGRRAAVLENLSVLGTADPVGLPQDLQDRSYAQDLESDGVRFFADARGREAAERYLQSKRAADSDGAGAGEDKAKAEAEGVIVGGAEESVRKVVFDRAVRGQHDKMAFVDGPVGTSRNWHLRAETYTARDVASFEKKLVSLVGAGGKGGKGGAQKKTAAKA